MATWVLNDETIVNSYGFRLPNANADLERFKANPLMLAMHKDWDLGSVIGRWKNIRIEGTQLLAEDEFDMEDPEAAKIAGKVERGFIKGCSLGIFFPDPESFAKAPDGVWEPSRWEPYEDSIVTVPSSKGALRLYSADGELMTDEVVNLSLSAISKKLDLSKISEQPKPKNSNMEKFTLSGGALAVLLAAGLTDQNDPVAVNATIAKLGADLKTAKDNETTAKTALQTMKDAQLTAAKNNATAIVDAAITAGKITADKKESFITLGVSDPGMLSTVLESLPGKTTLGAQVTGNPHGGADDPKTVDEFVALPLAKQLAFKEQKPEAYQALFK